MAFVPKDPNLEDEQGQGQGEPGAPPPAGESSALGTGAAPGGTAGGKATPQNRTASSSGFTNLNKYVAANQPQAAALGGQIKSKIGETINQASTQAADVDKGYADKVNPNQYAFDAKKFDPLKQDKAQFQNLFTAPKSTFGSAGEVDSATKAIETAKTKVGQVDTIGGRKELINDQQSLSKAAGANTAGLRSFDNLLLQSSKEGQDAMAAAKGDFEAAGLDAKLKAAQDRAKAVDAQAMTNQQAASAQAKKALEGSYGSLNQSLDQRVAAAQQAGAKSEQALLDKVKNFQNLSAGELKQLGISKDQWEEAKGLAASQAGTGFFDQGLVGGGWNMDPYIQRSGSFDDLGRQNVISQDEIAKLQALQSLAGISGSKLDFKGMPTAPSSFNNDTLDFNVAQFLKDLTPKAVKEPTKLKSQSKATTGVLDPVTGVVNKGTKEVQSWFGA
jgi:hypothetical protein